MPTASSTAALQTSLTKNTEEKQVQGIVKTRLSDIKFKSDLVSTVLDKIQKSEIMRGEEKFLDFMMENIWSSKKGGEDLFAEIKFDEEKKAQLLEDKHVKAFLKNSHSEFKPINKIYSLEHTTGIGEPDKKGKQTTPEILTISSAELTEIKLAEYGIDINELLKKHELATIRLALTFVTDSNNPEEKQPVLAMHLSSGNDDAKKATRKAEEALIEEIQLALLKKHKVIYTGGDGQVNRVKINKDGKPTIKNGRMVENEELRAVLASIKEVTYTDLEFTDVKLKMRGINIGVIPEFKGLSTVSNQQEKTEPDAGSKFKAGTVRAYQAGDLPNSKLLDEQILPPEGSEDVLATSKQLADHVPVTAHSQEDKLARIYAGGLSQEGFKAFQDPHDFYNSNAFTRDKQGNEVVSDETLMASVTFTGKFYSLLISNCLRVKVRNIQEKPVVDPIAIKSDKQMTSFGYMEEFYASLVQLKINPFKSVDEIVNSVDFTNENLMRSLSAQLKLMGLDEITSREELHSALQDKNKSTTVCMVLNAIGLDPFKSEEEILSAYQSLDRSGANKFVVAMNKLLQVQAIDDDLSDKNEEKKQDQAHADFSYELREAFTNSYIQLLNSDEFDQNYYPFATEEHIKLHGYSRKVDRDLIPEGIEESDIAKHELESFKKRAEVVIKAANARSNTGSRSPINNLFRNAFNMEIAGGFVKAANRTPNSNEVILSLSIEHALKFFTEHMKRNVDVVMNITETSTKGLKSQAKNGKVGDLYGNNIVEIEQFYHACRMEVLSQNENIVRIRVAGIPGTTFGKTASTPSQATSTHSCEAQKPAFVR